MIFGYDPLIQTALGCAFTWLITFLGAAGVIFVRHSMRAFLAASLGFSGGVMTAASFWSLLQPAIDKAAEHGRNGAFYGERFSILPVVAGFLFGALFVHVADILLDRMGAISVVAFAKEPAPNGTEDKTKVENCDPVEAKSVRSAFLNQSAGEVNSMSTRAYNLRRRPNTSDAITASPDVASVQHEPAPTKDKVVLPLGRVALKRIMLLLTAITLHNVPEGLAVGVGFGAARENDTVAFAQARNLAIGIGLQNFPEGLAVSLPLRAAGFSTGRALFYGQLSGAVEPVAGLIGCIAIQLVEPLVPFALALAAGAMIYVVVHDVLPEAFASAAESRNESVRSSKSNAALHKAMKHNSVGSFEAQVEAAKEGESEESEKETDLVSRAVSWWFMCGFTIMMLLDVIFTD